MCGRTVRSVKEGGVGSGEGWWVGCGGIIFVVWRFDKLTVVVVCDVLCDVVCDVLCV